VAAQLPDEDHVVGLPAAEDDGPLLVDLESVAVVEGPRHLVVGQHGQSDRLVAVGPERVEEPLQ
jgi:hypothetical protein